MLYIYFLTFTTVFCVISLVVSTHHRTNQSGSVTEEIMINMNILYSGFILLSNCVCFYNIDDDKLHAKVIFYFLDTLIVGTYAAIGLKYGESLVKWNNVDTGVIFINMVIFVIILLKIINKIKICLLEIKVSIDVDV